MVLIKDVILSDASPQLPDDMIHTIKEVFNGSATSPPLVETENKVVDVGKTNDELTKSNSDTKTLGLTDFAILAIVILVVTYSSARFDLDGNFSSPYMIHLFYAFTICILFGLYIKFLK